MIGQQIKYQLEPKTKMFDDSWGIYVTHRTLHNLIFSPIVVDGCVSVGKRTFIENLCLEIKSVMCPLLEPLDMKL